MSRGIIRSVPTPTQTLGKVEITLAGDNGHNVKNGDLLEYEDPKIGELKEGDGVTCGIVSDTRCIVHEIEK